MHDLPHGVWELVATHISQEELLALAAVNRTFLNITLDTRFGEVEWIQPNQRMVKALIRLLWVLDPSIANRVKRLYIRNSIMQQLLRDTTDFKDPMPGVYGVMGKLYGFITKTPACEPSQSSRSVYNPYLRELILHTTFMELLGMLAGTTLLGLDELDLTFEQDAFPTPSDVVANLAISITAFAPHINTLKICSRAYQDHSQFFMAIGPFPKLRHLSLRVQFDGSNLSDSSGINQMLRQHRPTLHDLEVLPEFWDVESVSQTIAWAAFQEQCLLDLDQWPTGLQMLTIPATDLPTTMSLVRPVAATLTSLRLAYKYLTYLEVADVVDLFHRQPKDMKHLSLDVRLATPNLLNLLARKLPGLLSLTLVIEDATSTMQSILRTDPTGSDNIDWGLFDFSIFNKKFRDDSACISAPMSFEFEEGLMSQFSSLLPSVRSFKGRGHTEMVRIC
ncbi:hypothetical protein H0H87_008521 [Tephrocybe sp. NHM501043]|nr:hypothetical protein H0H87_008521 [Tephrocybe sp. NHM501043]